MTNEISGKVWVSACTTLLLLTIVNFHSYSAKSSSAKEVSTDRTPASVAAPLSVGEVVLPCESEDVKIGPELKMVRVIFSKCKGQKLPSVINRTNGHTASTFHFGGKVSSDFISLNVGENEIEVDWQGEVTHIINLVRGQ